VLFFGVSPKSGQLFSTEETKFYTGQNLDDFLTKAQSFSPFSAQDG
jgi:hypothetical protein